MIPEGWSPFDTTGGDDAYYSAPGSDSAGVITCPTPVNPASGITQWGDRKTHY